ncbi:DNA-directed RNA polymerase subunit beta' [Staphylococcus pseudoxylosus]|uniref:DNA-directed RNA polymerase subunit beta' n=1 Tax=Staphylococcus pseudoxylosus TaxID=2282419 RepID=UPI0018ED5A4F|nr:DNA-directed RNA polymerase subunit beta' [Staphylococcus pseudoxylosus]MDW8796964.1 DNA-directed RNA polymerase subunit beta' [Staphylococcus pseudoxylosus]MEB6038140.1 DNA-directed RNA polymerase subunit beta' [Staphylococcus pseudoxylosus]MEB6045523.1 DNA-directed RNA polymerase subunit beta' [Staphylococcus pseudoxylosus]MEB6061852.1 DNA-directed RNA polymerase subunit beta' [Staphylococcus pseudoxylosus]MEB7765393.1 DNA-directed RNA polymerase subunit beta' [Staphylococcus pseudoxylosu
MKIGLASPEKIRSWSFGEVKKPETINYRTLKPEKDGLFCERIFGPTKDWECSCGKYKRVRYKGMVCDRCGVEVTKSKVRRERMGHIELAAPVSHIWYFKGIPSRMGLLLDMSPRALEEVIYFASYVVVNPGPTGLEKKTLLSEAEFREYYDKFPGKFTAKMGAEGIKELLEEIDLDAELKHLRDELESATGQRLTRAIKRLEVVESFRHSGNNPAWMILDVLPIIPPEIRPMVQLDGGRFATSDLNDLYRRVINRNNRLKRLLDLGAPGIIVQNEKRMLQEAVDALIDNGRRGRPVTGPGNRPLKSLSHMLKGKQGRFRQNLLGKRVDYSGRSVIAVGPNLKMYQCGLPKEMALELFKPFIMKELVQREIATNIKNAKSKIERMDDEVWDVLEDVIKEHPVLLNRAPTLHRLGIQAFEPTLVEGRAIRLHPLATTAYNADFDGDQMAVHVPLSKEAQAEARMLMLAAQNILNPKDGKPVVTPSQDMVLGNYYLTLERKDAVNTGTIYNDTNEVLKAYANGYVHLHTRIGVHASSFNNPTFTEEQNKKILLTSVGKVIFNEIIPDSFAYINEPTQTNLENKTPERYFIAPTEISEGGLKAYFDEQELIKPFNKNFLGNVIAEVFNRFSITDTSMMLDRMKDLGFKFSSKAGITVGVSDIVVLPDKQDILDEHEKLVEKVTKQFNRGLITDFERYNAVIEIWTDAKDQIQNELMGSLEETNPIFMMSDSGARGNASNFTQLAGMRGLMAAPSGEIIELPITSSFREGLTVLEYFISTHGARKGLADTALKTADSGYLTRRLVDVAQDVIVREEDCGTDRGLLVSDIKEGTEMIEPFIERIEGRYSKETIRHPETDEVIVNPDQLVTPDIAKKITDAGIEEMYIRSAFTCNTRHGVCEKCYGKNLATGEKVEVGEAVGTIAAQSIGEPGTQLTMRTFHTGGVAGSDITQGLPRIQEIFEARNPKGQAVITEIEGVVDDIKLAKDRQQEIVIKGANETKSYLASGTSRLKVEVGQGVERGEVLTEGSIEPKNYLSVSGLNATESYLLKEVQKVYRMQGVEIDDKHVEVMVRQMLRKVRIIEAGDTKLLPGSLVDIHSFTDANREAFKERKRPATAKPVLLGITKASLETESFLSAASFQETTRVLTDAAIKGKRDNLLGLKENVIIGKLIPAGTGMRRYRDVEYDKATPDTEIIEEVQTTEI